MRKRILRHRTININASCRTLGPLCCKRFVLLFLYTIEKNKLHICFLMFTNIHKNDLANFLKLKTVNTKFGLKNTCIFPLLENPGLYSY